MRTDQSAVTMPLTDCVAGVAAGKFAVVVSDRSILLWRACASSAADLSPSLPPQAAAEPRRQLRPAP